MAWSRATRPCCGWSLWCILDWIAVCRFRWICDRHDRQIMADWCNCAGDHGYGHESHCPLAKV